MYNYGQVPISRRSDISIGSKVRFAFPEYSHDIETTTSYLSMNKIYTIKDFNLNGEFIRIYLSEIKDHVCFNSMQFIPEWTSYSVPIYTLKYISYSLKRLKKKLLCKCGS